jgi:hypothetical protein
MSKKIVFQLVLIALLAINFNVKAHGDEGLTKSAKGASVYIISPVDEAVVSEQVVVKFGIVGMEVAPAGTDKANTGHHHLLIDAETLPEKGQVMGGSVMHFGGGQTETTLKLSKGTHTLQLILGDKVHVPHDPMVFSKKITITVK